MAIAHARPVRFLLVQVDPDLCSIPVVVPTTSAADRVRASPRGVNSDVVKPVDFTQFRKAIHELQMDWAVLHEPAGR